ncbi:MAG: hypothetical protein AB1750_18070 [Chloroflexota bacterium]
MTNRPARYVMSSARLKEEGGKLVVRPNLPAWVSPVVGGGFFLLLAVAMFLVGGDSILLGAVMLAFTVAFLVILPMSIVATFDVMGRRLYFMADYLIRSPRRVEIESPFSQIAFIGFRPTLFNKPQWVEIMLADGNRVVLDFGRRKEESTRLVNELKSLAGTPDAPNLNVPAVVQGAVVAESKVLMQRELRNGAFAMLFIGVLQMISAGGFSPWGFLLIGVGLAAFYFREAPMFIIYATTMAWAALSNLLSAESGWIVLSLFQIYWTTNYFDSSVAINAPKSRMSHGPRPTNRPAALSRCSRGWRSFWEWALWSDLES